MISIEIFFINWTHGKRSNILLNRNIFYQLDTWKRSNSFSKGLQQHVTKIWELENQKLWQKLNFLKWNIFGKQK